MEAEAEHYRNFVAGSAPPPPKTTTATMRDTTRGQRGARQQWGGVRQWRTRLGHEVLPTLRCPKQGRLPKGRKEEEGLFGGEETQEEEGYVKGRN
jgi:hypothetical protein